MIAGKRYLGSNVDIWSCGVILFALICGYLPFEDPNTANLYKKILNGEYQFPSKFITPEGRDLIQNILNTDQKASLVQLNCNGQNIRRNFHWPFLNPHQ
jgi:5'-AMP-activated protein kinase, catalytic alpha subunit